MQANDVRKPATQTGSPGEGYGRAGAYRHREGDGGTGGIEGVILKVTPMKVSIIGGGGLVGSSAAFALQCGGVVSSICLIDANAELAQGQALDLLHGASLAAEQRIYAGDMRDVASSQVVVIT